MASRRGSFGLLLPDWEIADDRVTVARSWRAAIVGAALVMLGLWLATQIFERKNREWAQFYILGTVGSLVIGIAGLAASPLRGSLRRIEVTRDGVRIDGKQLASADVHGFSLEREERYFKGRIHHDWRLFVDDKVHPTMRSVVLARRHDVAKVAQTVVDAMNAVLAGGKPPQPLTKAPVETVELTRGTPMMPPRHKVTLEQWAPEGCMLRSLTEPISEPQWRHHLDTGKVVEQACYGDYDVMVIEPARSEAAAMKYLWRVFVLPQRSVTPVLAVNAERSMMGTSAYGAHVGARHTNHGPCPPDVDYATFRERAQFILADELIDHSDHDDSGN